MSSDPVIAEVWRGDVLEGLHHGALAVTGPSGQTRFSFGDVLSPMLPRSAVKPFQAVAMLRHGLDLEGAELALAAASHSGEPFHLEAVLGILDGAGLDARDLANTAGLPIDGRAESAWLAAGRQEERLAHNCSGKHAAMLRTCVRAGWPTEGYLDPDHPLQRAAAEVIAAFTGEEPAAALVDGCGAPAFVTSLAGLARAFGTLASAVDGPARRVADAYRAHPEYASGSRRYETVLHREVPGLVCKQGAEGVLAIGLADGTGIAIKVNDGHDRAAVAVAVALLEHLGHATENVSALDPYPVLGHGRVVGRVVASAHLVGSLPS